MHVSEELEQAFWAKVWRCSHRHPCKRCCWPWRANDLSVNWRCVWQDHGTFGLHRLGVTTMAAPRFAYELQHGTITLTSNHFHLCHLCHFGPCCNPVHLTMGSASDNARDKRAPAPARVIRLPDGQVWSYVQACHEQDAFYEAWFSQTAWDGPVPARFATMARELRRLHDQATPRGPGTHRQAS